MHACYRLSAQTDLFVFNIHTTLSPGASFVDTYSEGVFGLKRRCADRSVYDIEKHAQLTALYSSRSTLMPCTD